MPTTVSITFTDPAAFAAAFPQAVVDLKPTAPGQFQAQLTIVTLKRLQLLNVHESAPRVATISLNPPVACAVFPVRAATPATLARTPITVGDIAYVAPGGRFCMRTPGGFGWGCLLFQPLRPGRTRPSAAAPSSDLFASPARPAIRRLLRLHARVARLCLARPELIRSPGAARNLEEVLMEAMLSCLNRPDPRTPVPFLHSRPS